MAGPGSRNGTSRGGRNGNQSGGNEGRGSAGGSNDRNDKSMQGRGGQNDVAGRSSPTGDSADNGSHTGRTDDRRLTNPFAASRQADAIAGLVSEDARRHDSFDHARRSMTVDEKREAADVATDHNNDTVNKVFDGAGLIGSLVAGPVAAPVASLTKSLFNAKTKSDMMESLGEEQGPADVASDTARGFVPGLLGSMISPLGAEVGFKAAGPAGALLASKTLSSGVTEGLASHMTPENMTGAPQDPNDTSNGEQSANPISPEASAPTERAKTAFGYAPVDVNRYSAGLINAKV